MNDVFPLPVEDFIFSTCRVLARQNMKSEVSVLLAQTGLAPEEGGYDGFGGGSWTWGFTLRLPMDVYAQMERLQWTAMENRFNEAFLVVLTAFDSHRAIARIVPQAAKATQNWRAKAEAWATGKSLSNQGRVRSDNIAAVTEAGLLFRSRPEIELFKALKKKGVTLAPLPVFVRGDGSRFEPDFLIIYEGIVLVVEVDGDSFHLEKPVDAHERLEVLTKEGVKVHRIRASACSDPRDADVEAGRILDVLKKHKASSR